MSQRIQSNIRRSTVVVDRTTMHGSSPSVIISCNPSTNLDVFGPTVREQDQEDEDENRAKEAAFYSEANRMRS